MFHSSVGRYQLQYRSQITNAWVSYGSTHDIALALKWQRIDPDKRRVLDTESNDAIIAPKEKNRE